MRIHWKDKFKDDCERLEKRLKQFAPFKKALFHAIKMLQSGRELSEKYTVNRIVAEGEGWYVCYFYEDFVIIYKIQGDYVTLSRLGTAKELEKER